jgi:hypothetical protein
MGPPSGVYSLSSSILLDCFMLYSMRESRTVTLRKIECSKQAFALNTVAWNNTIGFRFYFVGFRTEIMINRNSRGRSYLTVRGEILRFVKDELMRKHSPRMLSLIKNES